MEDKLENMINSCSEKFDSWRKIINDHSSGSGLNSNIHFSEDEYLNLTYKVVDILAELSDIYFKYGAFKDQFDNSKMSFSLFGPHLIIVSIKTGNIFNLGIDNRGLYIDTFMRYPENLRYMDDSFYKDLFALTALGQFELQETESYSSQTKNKYDPLFSNQKSIVFRLLRNYIVGMAERSRDIPLGKFHIYWSFEYTLEDIIYNSCLAFKILYRLNYSLWKIHDLQSKQ